jgi:hypothetical protein
MSFSKVMNTDACDICSEIYHYLISVKMLRSGLPTADRPEEWLSPEAKKVLKDKPDIIRNKNFYPYNI